MKFKIFYTFAPNNLQTHFSIMKKYAIYFLSVIVAMSFASCKKSPQYIYVDNMNEEAKVSFIDGVDDNDAYSKAFENYSNARFYPLFSEYEKTRKYIAENDSASEACEGIEGEVAPPDNSEGGSIISTDDDVNSLDAMGDGPVYVELSRFNAPTFTLYKITDSSARSAAEVINLYDSNFDACVTIDRKVFDSLQKKLTKALEKIDKDAARKQGDAVE